MGGLIGRAVVPGTAEGPLVVSRHPLSFWGGYDPATGEIIDRRHPLSGRSGAGVVLALPSTRGSSTTTAVLLEAIRAGTAPAAFVTSEADVFLALASVVADEMYGSAIPIVELDPTDFDRLEDGRVCRMSPDGRLVIEP